MTTDPYMVVNPDGKELHRGTWDECNAFKESYDAHPVNYGRRLAKVIAR